MAADITVVFGHESLRWAIDVTKGLMKPEADTGVEGWERGPQFIRREPRPPAEIRSAGQGRIVPKMRNDGPFLCVGEYEGTVAVKRCHR